MRCKKCNIQVENGNVCPLCHQSLDGNPNIQIVSDYPPKQKPRPLPRRISVKNIYLIVAIVVALLSILLCYLVKPFTYHWCWFVVAVLVYGYLLIGNTIYSNSEIGAKIFMQGACFIALGYIIDAIFRTALATHYVLPIIISLMIATAGINLLIFYKHNRSLFISCIFMSLFGFIPIILYACEQTFVLIPAIISAVLGGVTLLCSIIFGIKRLKEQFEKVFHL